MLVIPSEATIVFLLEKSYSEDEPGPPGPHIIENWLLQSSWEKKLRQSHLKTLEDEAESTFSA